MTLSIALRAPVNPTTGYGRDGIGLALALARAGVRLTLQPTFVIGGLPKEFTDLLTHEPADHFDALIHHVEPDNLGLTTRDLDVADLRYAWSMWEFTRFSDLQIQRIVPRLQGYDRIVAYDKTSAAAFSGLQWPSEVDVLQGGYEPGDWLTEPSTPLRDWDDDTFVFSIAGDLTPRKNTFAACRVMQQLRADGVDVVLRVKSRAKMPMQASQIYPDVEFYDGVWEQKRMRDFYATSHGYIAPSWGEGKNLPALEAATTGAVPVLSACGGHRQWARPDSSVLVDGAYNFYEETPYFVVDEGEMYDKCKALVEDRGRAREMGDLAADTYPRTMSWDRAASDILTLVREDLS